ncbi:MAG: hypothetical protein E7L01_21020 [Paenibacillus macerans]|uniref:DUF4878 domain-containing protein n=1 Tax=Paenibacillus macerans TaxID=44252 RepID=A0A6N8ERW4_PAEMA|nr:hypothetical protein [Paenibacillus macerans]MDU7475789.1 hypothetical protein [Paenibacillus macerans]MEC0137658.1 hypothetical protein [Paenibacillus macerans]MEC0149862.1 hypothetical protein [Paenibacillus macerans]MEC0330877.1 hypothetical protein [Paenibacillus macerans]MUG21201.1 hypothetical protein [Paenibacillus macerans]
MADAGIGPANENTTKADAIVATTLLLNPFTSNSLPMKEYYGTILITEYIYHDSNEKGQIFKMVKILRKRNLIILGFIILLFGVYTIDWSGTPQPVKAVNHYLMLVQKKNAQDAYQMLYIQNSKSRLYFETYKESVYSDPLIEYKIKGSSKIDKKIYYVSTYINMDGWETDHTFEVRKIDGKWKIVY